MLKNRTSYPYCQFGQGPRKEYYLPNDIRGLADDPYRSLAWFVRKAGAFENSEKNFAEFTWANFFRSKKLPGYGKLNLSKQAKVKTAVRKRMKLQRQLIPKQLSQ